MRKRVQNRGLKRAVRIILLLVVAVWGYLGYRYFFTVTQKYTERTVELGSKKLSSDPHDFFIGREKNLESASVDTSEVDTKTIGDYRVRGYALDHTYTYTIHVKDTTAPSIAKDKKAVFGNKNSYQAKEIGKVSDKGEIKSFYVTGAKDAKGNELKIKEHAFSPEDVGEYQVILEATDESGNEATKEVSVKVEESPHFLMVADRKIQVGSDFDPSEFVFAEDKDNKDVSDSVTVDAGDYNYNKSGEYTITAYATDKKGIKGHTSFKITVGDFGGVNDYGFTDSRETRQAMLDHGYFKTRKTDGNNTDASALATERSSVGIKGGSRAATCYCFSGFVCKVTADKVYFGTARHCLECFPIADTTIVANSVGTPATINTADIKTIQSENHDTAMFSVPTSYFDFEYLRHLREVIVDSSVYDRLPENDTVVMNIQSFGMPDVSWSDIILPVKARSFDQAGSRWGSFDESYVVTDKVTKQGESGGPLFDKYGELIGINSCIIYLPDGTAISCFCRLEGLTELTARLGEL
jgi:hypothetical protein